MEDVGPTTILVVTAHPDDVDFGAAGTIAQWIAEGRQVSYCIITDGDAGGSDENLSREEMAATRRREQTAAAAAVGVTDIHFLGHPDGRLTPSMDVRHDITKVIRELQPQRVVCQSSERNWSSIYASHPDHLAAGEATLCAVYPDSRNPFAHPDLAQAGLRPHTVPEVWIMGSERATHWVDITPTFAKKVSALHCHKSQFTHMDGLDERLRSMATGTAQRGGLVAGRLAEAFHVIATP